MQTQISNSCFNKRVIFSVTCANDFASDVPVIFSALIDDTLASRIRMLAEKVRELDVYEIVEFNNQGIWSCTFIDAENIQSNLDSVIGEIDSNPSRVELTFIHVTTTTFNFTAYPKHGPSLGLTTCVAEICDLQNTDPLILVH